MRSLTSLALVLTALAGPAFAAPSGTITVYTSQPQDQMAQVVEAFNKDYPDVKVEIFRSGTTELMSKLQAEFAAGSTPADIVLLADEAAMTQLKTEGRLQPYLGAPVADIPANLVDPDKTFFGTKLLTTGIVYNTDLVKEAPKSWAELKADDTAKSLIMPSPLYSGAAVIHVGTIVQQPEFGWGYYEDLAAHGAVAGQGNGTVIEAVARGEKAYGIIVEYMAMNAKAKGSPVDFVWPEDGVSTITQPVAIVKGTDNEEGAQAFIDWQLGKSAQEQSVQQGYFPILKGMARPAGYPDPEVLKVLPVDVPKLIAEDAANKEKFSDLFSG